MAGWRSGDISVFVLKLVGACTIDKSHKAPSMKVFRSFLGFRRGEVLEHVNKVNSLQLCLRLCDAAC